MIKKLRRKFVLTIMSVVTLILLAIFFTMLFTTQRNGERMSESMLEQAVSKRPPPSGAQPNTSNRPPRAGINSPNMRLPILVLDVDKNGDMSTLLNQLHFIGEEDIPSITELALTGADRIGILPEYGLRYLRERVGTDTRIAFADISMEQEVLKTQIITSLLIGGTAMLIFFFLSIALAHWAVRPMEVAWERQKQFIANASHELKTPLTVILSNADMLRKSELGSDENNILRMEHVYAEAKRMKRLVDNMLALARTDSAQISSLYNTVDFSYIVKSAVLMYEPIAYDENKSLSYEIEDGLTVMGDKARLHEVVLILLDNAQKYSPHGGSIHICMKKTERNHLLLRVSNSGVLIPQNELKNIFSRFYRLDESRSGHDGFGLGLPIAQSIVSAHKGKIWAQSDEQAGNSFCITLTII